MLQNPLPDNQVFPVTRDEDDPEFRTKFSEPKRKIRTLHSGHNDIGEEEVNGSLMPLGDLQRNSGAGSLQNRVARFRQNFRHQTPDARLVFSQQDRGRRGRCGISQI